MRRSADAALAIVFLAVAALVVASPAHAWFAFPAFGLAFADTPVSSSDTPPDTAPVRGTAIVESDNGKSFGVQKGEMLTVNLKETDPAQSWRYTGQGNFRIVDDAVLESYPAQHVFRVKVKGPGDLMFAKVDSRSGDVVERFGAHVVIEEPQPQGVLTRYPLYAFDAVDLSPGLLGLWQ